MWTEIAAEISKNIGAKFTVDDYNSVSGGCINQGYRIKNKDRSYFVKLNRADRIEMFAAEALGLKQMLATNTIRVPKPICWGSKGNNSYIVMEWLEFASGDPKSWQEMGQKLAKMHRVKVSSKFGWEVNNTIGDTPQINTKIENWADFFAEHRIGYQIKLARRKGGNFSSEIVEVVRKKLADRQPQPSLVHGDLWSGNAAVTIKGEPVILDPATYWGDREVDIAMTEVFGGFPAAFYRGYSQEWELDPGYQQRKKIYNLYHILNHFNLFGGGYGSQASRMISQITS
ncbi:MAG: fructosamine kinase family protein [Prochloraceae cyanobacterium]